MFESRMLFLVGAGGSIPLGIPGMAGLAADFESSLSRNSWEASILSALKQYGAGSDLEELLQLANEICEFPESELAAFVDDVIRGSKGSSASLSSYRRRRTNRGKSVADFRNSLLEDLTARCLQFDRDEASRVYGPLVAELASSGTPVYTTNYDGVFEYVAADQNIGLADNFQQKKGRWFWDETLESFAKPGLKLIKLHGSVYWHALPDGRIEKIDPPPPRSTEGKLLERLLIVPTRFKDIYLRNYFPLYTNFLRTLGQASLLVVVGHSLRDEYLLAAVRDRLRDPEFRMIMVDPKPPDLGALSTTSSATATDQVVILKRSAGDVTPLLLQLVRSPSTSDALRRAESAVSALLEGEADEITVKDLSHWVPCAERHSFTVRVSTTIGGGSLRGRIRLNGGKIVDLEDCLSQVWGDDREFYGVCQVERRVPLYFAKQWGRGPHELVFELVSRDGEVLASTRRSFRLKKVA